MAIAICPLQQAFDKYYAYMRWKNLSQLTIQCKLTIHNQSPVVTNSSSSTISAQRSHIFTKMLTDSKWHDVSFVVKGKRFGAPISFLVEQSPVFAAMFTGEWTEAIQKCATIDNIEPEVFAELLRFLVTGAVSQNEALTIELLAAAEKVMLQ